MITSKNIKKPREGVAWRSFPKRDRLCSKKLIEFLFSPGSRAVTAYPLRVVVRESTIPKGDTQVMFSVAKRHFKHAVDRNRIKRQLRVAWVSHRHILATHNLENRQILVAIIWLADDLVPSAIVNKRLQQALAKISTDLYGL